MISTEIAKKYLTAGLSVLPAVRERKFPAVGKWKTWQERLPTEIEVEAWFANKHDAVCIVCGEVSGNLEVIDFDNHGELFPKWKESILGELLAKHVIEQTPSGGYLVSYRCKEPICCNIKLAQGERDGKMVTLIETRGNGGLVLCAPTEGYELRQGDYDALPVLTMAERISLLDAAWKMNEKPESGMPKPSESMNGNFAERPGDDFNARGDIRTILIKHGWTSLGVQPDGNEYWRRPGKTDGNSATLKDGVF